MTKRTAPTTPAVPGCFKVKVNLSKNGATIILPNEALSLISLNKGHAFCTLVDGVAQISGKQPNVVIPPLSLDPASFVSQTNSKRV